MPLTLIDASVACKWVLGEDDSARAKELLEENAALAAPSILAEEVTGAIVRRFRAGALPEPLARDAYHEWTALIDEGAVHLLPVDQLRDDAVDLALRMKHPFVDCLYLAAARRLHASLLTADTAFFERAGRVYERVELFRRAA